MDQVAYPMFVFGWNLASQMPTPTSHMPGGLGFRNLLSQARLDEWEPQGAHLSTDKVRSGVIHDERH